MRVAGYGRRLGIRLLRRGFRLGFSYLLTPVNITRYFEFDFVVRHLKLGPLTCLDVSSPRLCSLYIADQRPEVVIQMLNPDHDDAETTALIVGRLGFSNVAVSTQQVSSLADKREQYDCIWSVSVVEHIAGEDGDTEAVRLMYEALRPGGRLLLTVPVDRQFWVEYRADNYYGVHNVRSATGQFFFQRLYDDEAVRRRLVEPLGVEPTVVSWFGERVRGTFSEYERLWMELGPDETIDDPRRIVDDYQLYTGWAEMPGFGVVAMVIDKPTPGEV